MTKPAEPGTVLPDGRIMAMDGPRSRGDIYIPISQREKAEKAGWSCIQLGQEGSGFQKLCIASK